METDGHMRSRPAPDRKARRDRRPLARGEAQRRTIARARPDILADYVEKLISPPATGAARP
jgi:hypothetical protein